MATSRTASALVRARPYQALSPLSRHFSPATNAAFFSSSARRPATSEGPPPQHFRMPRQERWNEKQESTLDKAGNYFLLTEMLRGMYVVLEQFFRPP